MLKIIVPVVVLGVLAVVLVGCARSRDSRPESQPTYQQISQEEAKKMMNQADLNALILDVREQDEFDESHIPGAVLLPVGSITEATAAKVIGAKDDVVLVYCRSGNRSKTASQKLAELGYTNVYEFGGIKTWPYEVE